jgi:excisionase family DNA binding protein
VSVAENEGVFAMATGASRPKLLTVTEVAELLRVSNMTVYRLIKAGELGSLRVGKSVRLREDDIDRYLADRYTRAG